MAGKSRFGKYRGIVTTNLDPMQIGRVQVSVPDLPELASGVWAMPCVPFAGAESGFYVAPPVGAAVWVEFERGDPDYPIWVGGFWTSAADVPVHSAAPTIVLQTSTQTSLTISDEPGANGGIRIRTATGAMISVSDAGIVIENGRGAIINMIGPKVDVNSGALTII